MYTLYGFSLGLNVTSVLGFYVLSLGISLAWIYLASALCCLLSIFVYLKGIKESPACERNMKEPWQFWQSTLPIHPPTPPPLLQDIEGEEEDDKPLVFVVGREGEEEEEEGDIRRGVQGVVSVNYLSAERRPEE